MVHLFNAIAIVLVVGVSTIFTDAQTKEDKEINRGVVLHAEREHQADAIGMISSSALTAGVGSNLLD
jgi:hypothetical protein